MAYEKFYEDGWGRLSSEVGVLDAYWSDGFPPAVGEEEARSPGWGPDNRVSPVLNYSRGIGYVQWVNVTHNTAAILRVDGTRETGGTFHLWISPGAGTRPYEVQWINSPTFNPGEDAAALLGSQQQAEAAAVAYLGLQPLKT